MSVMFLGGAQIKTTAFLWSGRRVMLGLENQIKLEINLDSHSLPISNL